MGDCQIMIYPDAQFLAMGLPDDSISITMDEDAEYWSGFYFYSTGDDDTLAYCHVFNNNISSVSHSGYREVFRFVGSSTVFQNTFFENNTVTSYASLLDLSSSNLVLSNCRFSNNTTHNGLLEIYNSNPLIEQTLFCDNITTYLVYIYSNSQVTFNNNTVKQNTASRLIYLYQMSCLNIWNSIIWDNVISDDAIINTINSDYRIEIAYSNIDTLSKQLLESEDLSSGFHCGPGNLCRDPLFADNNGFLQAGSPCIDAANPNDPLGNEPFPHGFRRNMGAWGGTDKAAATEGVFLTVVPSELAFGLVTIGQPVSKTVYCKNGCNEAINISSIELTDTTDFKISDLDEIKVLQPGMIDSFTIVCNPQQGNDENISSVVFNCTNCPSETLHVTGTGVEDSVVKAGNVSGVWTKESSPYTVLGNINIQENKSLVIEQGVHVKFNGPYRLTIGTGAQLKAMGTENDSIYFYAADTSKGWLGLYFNHSEDDDTLGFCNITGVRTFTDEYFNSFPACAVRTDNSDLTLSHSCIYNNTNDTNGVGFYGDSASVSISHCCFRNNHSLSSGSAFYLSQCHLKMNYSSVMYNDANTGSAFRSVNSTLELTNVTCAFNKSSYIKGSSFDLAGGNKVLMKNCIFWHNTASYYTFCYMDKTDYIDMSYSNIDTTRSSWLNLKNENVYDWQESNISQDPMFVDADLHLDVGSPSIDAGDPNDDMKDELFPHGYRVNQGAYGGTKSAAQTSGVHLTIAPNPVDLGYIQPGSDVNFDLYLKNGCVADLGIKQVLLSDSVNMQCLNNLNPLKVTSGHIDTLHFKLRTDSLMIGAISKSILVQTNDDQNTIIKIIGNVHKGSTITEGPINGILQKEGGPYIVSGNIYVPSSEILTITAGTELLFLENSSLQIPENAGLQVNGTLDDPVCFMAIDTSKGWGGIKIISSQDDDTLRHCLIRDCKNRQTYSDSKGGGLFISESSPYMDYVTISDNRAYYGGGVYISKSSPYINHSTIQNNNAYNGSALFVVGSTPVISNSYFFENLADSEGAIYLKNSSPIFNNTMICNNNSNEGGAFYCAGSNKKIILSNVTISANHAQQNAGAFYLNSIDSLFINNSIIWHNQARYGKEFYTYSYYRLSTCYVDLDYCDIDTTMSYWNKGSYTNNYFKVNIHWRSTNIVANPQFVDTDLNDYRLASGSPCIDRGNPDPAFNDPEDVLNPGQALSPSQGNRAKRYGRLWRRPRF